MGTDLCPSSVMMSNSRWLMHEGNSSSSSSTWTKEENKTFESALAIFDEESPDRWFKVAAMIPTKSVYDIINQYRELVADVTDIEAGFVPIPGYHHSSSSCSSSSSSSFAVELHTAFQDMSRKKALVSPSPSPSPCRRHERKKGVPWTEAEHRRFLLGLEKHGKGDWKNISRNFVVSKSPTQVASHAQKYYMRQQQQLSGTNDKRRPSIHDITIHLVGSTNSTPPTSEDTIVMSSLHSPQHPPTLLLDSTYNHHMLFHSQFVAYPYTHLL